MVLSGPSKGFGGGGLGEETRRELYPDPDQSPAEPAEKAKHLQSFSFPRHRVDRTQILTFVIIKLSLT